MIGNNVQDILTYTQKIYKRLPRICYPSCNREGEIRNYTYFFSLAQLKYGTDKPEAEKMSNVPGDGRKEQKEKMHTNEVIRTRRKWYNFV